MEFVNLKLHTDYSLLEGVSTVDTYIQKAKLNNSKYLGITDTSMFSAIKFYNSCKKNNISPVIGLELFSYGLFIEGEYSINVYAIGYEGYKKLVKLSTLSYSRYVSGRPIIDIQEIQKNSSNLVCITGGVNSEILKAIVEMEYDYARKIIMKYSQIFQNFYVEIPAFEIKKRHLDKYIQIVKELKVPYVITNDVYYADSNDFYLQKIVSAIKENVSIDRVKKAYPYNDLYLKTTEQIIKSFKEEDLEFVNQGILNTEKISEICKLEMPQIEFKFPKLKLDVSEKEYLRDLVYNGAKIKYKNLSDEVINRIEYELSVIDNMGFNGYFIIVSDIVKYANENDILIGPGRGSASGSIVSYTLDITKVDPIKYGLIFERFLNSGRKSMPDIDIDFEPSRRDEVVHYLMQKYGMEYVSNIIVFSRLQEKQLQKDLERVLGNSSRVIKQALEKLEGNVRHSSIHPSGVVISKYPLIDEVPTYRDDKLNINVTQYQMEELEYLGLLKIDLLALKNLEVIKQTINAVKIKLSDIDLNDKKTFEMFNTGNTLGVFQSESPGMVDLITKFKVENFLDISAILALYRPGPLNSGMTYEAIKRKHSENIDYIFPELEEILKDTYGVIIYQEQIMKIASIIAGYTLLEADELRKAISKKKIEILKLHKDQFVSKAISKGYDKQKVINLYSMIESFGGYGFNKSHTIPYSMLCYYTAYLKTNYTLEYICSLLNSDINDYKKLRKYEIELKKYKHQILKPSVNKSNCYFKVYNDNVIYGIYSIKGISENIAKSIETERDINGEFKNINDFCYRMIKYDLNKKHIEVLALSGAFDEFNLSRKEIFIYSQEIYDIAYTKYDNEINVGRSLFLTNTENLLKYENKFIDEYNEDELIEKEMESIGLLLSIDLKKESSDILSILRLEDNLRVGLVLSSEISLTRRKEKMLKLTIDENGEIKKYIIFSNLYEKIQNINLKNKICLFEVYNDVIKDIVTIDEVSNLKNTSINILIDDLSDENKQKLKSQFKQGGFSLVNFYKQKQRLKMNNKIYAKLSNDFIKTLILIVNSKNINVYIKNLSRVNIKKN
ncbi:DNA polymerase III subunit alpha [Caviibacter abscessus]|uniref:DNA polymerase III subunit alpha n=1 Tax=Caviibacter abscessus TaxID=1766719 RepID=UPI00083998D2|nr:DNA polymerase III subunit alpha [Caviibacter abscessus]